MAHSDEVGGSDQARLENAHDFLDFLASQEAEGFLGPLLITEGGSAADTGTGTGIDGTDTDAETSTDGGNHTTEVGTGQATKETKKKRER
jgi:hypothetical protein